MIQKVMPKINTIQPVRKQLKLVNSELRNLAGSSMSGWNTPKFEPTKMVIPGGLDFKEKAYFLLTGKMPKSVMERWVPNSEDYIPEAGDQIVTANISGRYVNGIVDAPQEYLFNENGESVISDISDTGETSFDLDDGDDFDILG